MKAFTIYGLTNEHGQIFYIGKAMSLVNRYSAHLKASWPFRLCGLAILEHVAVGQDDNAAERKWIKFFGRDVLCNKTNGGNGAWAYPPSQITIAKRSSALRQTFALPAIKQKLIDAGKLRWARPGERERQAQIIRNAYKDPLVLERYKLAMAPIRQDSHVRMRIAQSIKASWRNKSIRSKRSLAIKFALSASAERSRRAVATAASWRNPSIRNRIIASQKRTYATVDGKARKSAAMKLARGSAEARKQASESAKAMWRKRKEVVL